MFYNIKSYFYLFLMQMLLATFFKAGETEWSFMKRFIMTNKMTAVLSALFAPITAKFQRVKQDFATHEKTLTASL